MAASMWEVTGLILGAPGDADAAREIAQAHGVSPAEVADLLPLYLDNATLDWSASPVVPGTAPPDGAADDLAARWLADLGAQLQGQAGAVDIASYDAFGAPGVDGFDPGLDGFDDLGPLPDGGPEPGVPGDVPGPDPDPEATFGRGDDSGDSGNGAGHDGRDPGDPEGDVADGPSTPDGAEQYGVEVDLPAAEPGELAADHGESGDGPVDEVFEFDQ